MSKFSLANRKCLVTGGTRGIGRAIVNELVDLGAEVCMEYITVKLTVQV